MRRNFVPLRSAGTIAVAAFVTIPDLQSTTPSDDASHRSARRDALRPGHDSNVCSRL
jgi:hypothetical protein